VFALRGSFGFWPPSDGYGLVFLGAMAALSLAFIATLMQDHTIERIRDQPPLDMTDLALLNVALLTVGFNVVSTELLYSEEAVANAAVTGYALLGFITLVGFTARFYRFIVWNQPRPFANRSFVFFCAVTLLIGLLFRERVLRASPDPIVDVFALARDNADHILHGRNPYQHEIVSPYETERSAL